MINTYIFNKANRVNMMSRQKQTVSIIQSYFTCLGNLSSENKIIVGKPVFTVTADKVIVEIFYYRPKLNLTDINVATLGNALTRCWHLYLSTPKFEKRPKMMELRLIRLNHSTLDSSIFVQYLTANTNKYSFNRILDMIKNNTSLSSFNPKKLDNNQADSIISSIDEKQMVNGTELVASNNLELPITHLTGVKIKLSGRLTTQRSGPRQTVQAGRIGSSAKGSYGTVDYSKHTSKNKLGAFTMKV